MNESRQKLAGWYYADLLELEREVRYTTRWFQPLYRVCWPALFDAKHLGR